METHSNCVPNFTLSEELATSEGADGSARTFWLASYKGSRGQRLALVSYLYIATLSKGALQSKKRRGEPPGITFMTSSWASEEFCFACTRDLGNTIRQTIMVMTGCNRPRNRISAFEVQGKGFRMNRPERQEWADLPELLKIPDRRSANHRERLLV